MSVADWFSTFHSNLAITNGADISARYKRITQRLNTDFWNTQSDTAHSIYVGSYGRDTGIGKVSDLDMAFWLPYSFYKQYNGHVGNGQSALLQAVRVSIQKTYPTTALGADGQVLVINFTDNVKFEIVPCFENDDGSSFTYPDSNAGGSWKISNPCAEIAAIKNRNDATNGNLKRLCRMMRAWKNHWAVDMGGLLIDTLAYSFINTWPHTRKQIDQHDLPTRPTKRETKSGGVNTHSLSFADDESVELDALPPAVLRNMVRKAIERYVSPKLVKQVRKDQEAGQVYLRKLAAKRHPS